MSRFASATALGGRLYLDGYYQDEAVVDLFANPHFGHRKVSTGEELAEVIKVSAQGLPAIRVWINEGLVVEAQRVQVE